MIHFKTYLKKLDWCIECFITIDYSSTHLILEKLRKLGCSKNILNKAHNILFEQINSGFAYSNSDLRKSIMVINLSTSMDEFINTFNHEKNHIEMHICKADNIDPYSEEAAELSGQMAELLFTSMLHNF